MNFDNIQGRCCFRRITGLSSASAVTIIKLASMCSAHLAPCMCAQTRQPGKSRSSFGKDEGKRSQHLKGLKMHFVFHYNTSCHVMKEVIHCINSNTHAYVHAFMISCSQSHTAWPNSCTLIHDRGKPMYAFACQVVSTFISFLYALSPFIYPIIPILLHTLIRTNPEPSIHEPCKLACKLQLLRQPHMNCRCLWIQHNCDQIITDRVFPVRSWPI